MTRDDYTNAMEKNYRDVSQTLDRLHGCASTVGYFASGLSMTFPQLSEELFGVAQEIARLTNQIQELRGDRINLEFQDSQRQMGQIFSALVERIDKSGT